jgi:hypothetical protein
MQGLLMLNLTTWLGDLDIAFEPAGTEGYPDLAGQAEDWAVGAVTIRVASLADVIRCKEAAGRDKDVRAFGELYGLLRAQRGDDGS